MWSSVAPNSCGVKAKPAPRSPVPHHVSGETLQRTMVWRPGCFPEGTISRPERSFASLRRCQLEILIIMEKAWQASSTCFSGKKKREGHALFLHRWGASFPVPPMLFVFCFNARTLLTRTGLPSPPRLLPSASQTSPLSLPWTKLATVASSGCGVTGRASG